MQTSSLLGEFVEFLHRLNIFAFKPCEFCTETPQSDSKDVQNDTKEEKEKLTTLKNDGATPEPKQTKVCYDEDSQLYLTLDGCIS